LCKFVNNVENFLVPFPLSFSDMKCVKWISYHNTTTIVHDTFFSIRKCTSTCGVMLLAAVNSIFFGFVIMNFSVCFLEKVKICFPHFYIFINVKHFFFFFLQSTQFLCGIVWSWDGDSEILESTLVFVHDQRSAPSLSSRRKLIQLLLHRFVHKNTIWLTSLTSWNTSVVGLVASVPLLHTCSHSPRDYAQVPDN
jgi:hypothetical protein